VDGNGIPWPRTPGKYPVTFRIFGTAGWVKPMVEPTDRQVDKGNFSVIFSGPPPSRAKRQAHALHPCGQGNGARTQIRERYDGSGPFGYFARLALLPLAYAFLAQRKTTLVSCGRVGAHPCERPGRGGGGYRRSARLSQRHRTEESGGGGHSPRLMTSKITAGGVGGGWGGGGGGGGGTALITPLREGAGFSSTTFPLGDGDDEATWGAGKVARWGEARAGGRGRGGCGGGPAGGE